MNYYLRINKSDYTLYDYNGLKKNNNVITANDEKGEYILVPSELIDVFVVTTISREDIKDAGYNAENLSDEDMHSFAEDFEASLLESGEYSAYVSDLARNLELDYSGLY